MFTRAKRFCRLQAAGRPAESAADGGAAVAKSGMRGFIETMPKCVFDVHVEETKVARARRRKVKRPCGSATQPKDAYDFDGLPSLVTVQSRFRRSSSVRGGS
jgi:hypothetical protein